MEDLAIINFENLEILVLALYGEACLTKLAMISVEEELGHRLRQILPQMR